ncbi:hypothetical protein TNCV_3850781 [Trichonephila clavipes]|nr:hypothetical protein TNCV_3850781 [Trichonephila clavipes]
MKTALKDKTPSKLFEQFYFSEAYDVNAKENMQYAADVTNKHDLLSTADEIRVFIGILLLAGYHSNTRERDYWTATAGSDVIQSGRPIFDDFFQHLWPYIGNNTANVVFQMVKRLWLIHIDQ